MVDWRRVGASICTGAVCMGFGTELIRAAFPDLSECLKHGSAGICQEQRLEVPLPDHSPHTTQVGTPTPIRVPFATIASTGTNLVFQPGARAL